MLDTVYAIIQLVHNLGASVTFAASGYAALGCSDKRSDRYRVLVVWLCFGWLVQVLTGFSFGLASHYLRGEIPDVSGVALMALILKVICAVVGLLLGVWLLRSPNCPRRGQLFKIEWALSITALGAAAFLRWFL